MSGDHHLVKSGARLGKGLRTDRALVMGRSSLVEGDLVVGGDLSMARGSEVRGDVEVGGRCVVGAGSRVLGGLKVSGEAVLLDGSEVTRLEALEAEIRRAEARFVSTEGDLVLVGTDIPRFSVGGRVVARR